MRNFRLIDKYQLALWVFLVPFAVFGQGVRLGLSVSPQLSWMKSDMGIVESQGAKMGFNFGLQSDFFFAERYSFSTGLLINNTGGKLRYSDTLNFKTSDGQYKFDPGAEVDYEIQYIDVPLAFRMESNKIGYFVYYAQFGVTNHFRVGATADISAADGAVQQTLNGYGCKAEVGFFTMGYHIGSGINYYFSKNTAITVGFLYTNGFLDASRNTDTDFEDNLSVRSLMLKFGILF